jgi:hypothetical protein
MVCTTSGRPLVEIENHDGVRVTAQRLVCRNRDESASGHLKIPNVPKSLVFLDALKVKNFYSSPTNDAIDLRAVQDTPPARLFKSQFTQIAAGI